VTAVQLLGAEVLPTFEAHGAAIDHILSDNGREFCGRPTATRTSCSCARGHRASHY
jgi:hypothetical protein